MAASMVNIADFRCRDLKGALGHASTRVALNHSGLSVAETAQARKPDAPEEISAKNPAILDISAVRNNQRMRQRMVPHTVPVSRPQSNLVRFNEPRVAVMRIKQTPAMESLDDCDHPPAA
jgi:hypothetical protein